MIGTTKGGLPLDMSTIHGMRAEVEAPNSREEDLELYGEEQAFYRGLALLIQAAATVVLLALALPVVIRKKARNG